MRKPVIVRCRFLPTSKCVNLFGTFWARDTSWIDEKVVNHELIHTAQQKELLFIPFYVLYVLEWLLRLVQYLNHDKAYRNISFEREAYRYGNHMDYLRCRRHYAWIGFLREKKA